MADRWWYRVDREDRVLEVGPGWDEFAAANDAPGAFAERVVGRPLSEFIAESQTASMVTLLLERVRATNGPVELPFRCDAPAERRFLTWRGEAEEDGSVRVETRLLGTGGRDVGRLLDRSGESRPPIRQCSWCNRFAAGPGLWLELESAAERLGLLLHRATPVVTHGICPGCAVGLTGEPAATAPGAGAAVPPGAPWP